MLFAHFLGIPVGIITGENTQIVQRRANKLKVEYCFLGVKDKMNVVRDLCADLNISMSEVAYIGDDLNDMEVLSSVGFAGVTSSAPTYVTAIANIRLTQKGGDSVFREFVEYLIGEETLNNIISKVFLREQ